MRWRRKKAPGPFEAELRRAERNGLYVLPPGENDPNPLDLDAASLRAKYGSADDLPIEFAKRAIEILNLRDVPDCLLLVWAFLKDQIGQRVDNQKGRYPRLRMMRFATNRETYIKFYGALSVSFPDLPHPREGKVIHLFFSGKTKNTQIEPPK